MPSPQTLQEPVAPGPDRGTEVRRAGPADADGVARLLAQRFAFLQAAPQRLRADALRRLSRPGRHAAWVIAEGGAVQVLVELRRLRGGSVAIDAFCRAADWTPPDLMRWFNRLADQVVGQCLDWGHGGRAPMVYLNSSNAATLRFFAAACRRNGRLLPVGRYGSDRWYGPPDIPRASVDRAQRRHLLLRCLSGEQVADAQGRLAWLKPWQHWHNQLQQPTSWADA